MTRAQLRIALVKPGTRRLWGMTSAERIRRLAAARGIALIDEPRDADLLIDPDFAFDPHWLDFAAADPHVTVTWGGKPVLAHGHERLIAAESFSITDPALRKRERPFMIPIDPDNPVEAERACFRGAYKGVTDLLTKYLWPELAFHLARIACGAGLSPNMVTAIGFLFCVAAGVAFYHGNYWSGMAAGFLFMVLDTVDGKLARCTIRSSRVGDVFDHGIDLVHPPFWWWAWGIGLASYGTPLPGEQIALAVIAIVASYVLQRLIEGVFILLFAMHIHVWRPIDSHFRLITARRNPNMLLLAIFLAIGRPDIGLIALAIWSGASLGFHVVRLAQAVAERARGFDVRSWLSP